MCLNIEICQCLFSNDTHVALEFVGRGSETQLQVGNNTNKIA